MGFRNASGLVMVCLAATCARGQSRESAPIAVREVLSEFAIPGSRHLTAAVTYGDIKKAVPTARLDVVGPTSIGVGIRGRADSVLFGFVFDWDAGEIDDREVSDNARLSEFDLDWQGQSRSQFEDIAAKVARAFSETAVTQECLARPPSDDPRSRDHRMVEVMLSSSGWISTLLMMAKRERGSSHFLVQVRTFRANAEITRIYAELPRDRACALEPRMLLRGF